MSRELRCSCCEDCHHQRSRSLQGRLADFQRLGSIVMLLVVLMLAASCSSSGGVDALGIVARTTTATTATQTTASRSSSSSSSSRWRIRCVVGSELLLAATEDEEHSDNSKEASNDNDDLEDDDDDDDSKMMSWIGDGGTAMDGQKIFLEDLTWRVEKLRLEEQNKKRFLKAGPRFLPYDDCRRWVQAWGSRWESREEWNEWISQGEKRNAYIPSRPEEYYGRLGKWISWEHFLGTEKESKSDDKKEDKEEDTLE